MLYRVKPSHIVGLSPIVTCDRCYIYSLSSIVSSHTSYIQASHHYFSLQLMQLTTHFTPSACYNWFVSPLPHLLPNVGCYAPRLHFRPATHTVPHLIPATPKPFSFASTCNRYSCADCYLCLCLAYIFVTPDLGCVSLDSSGSCSRWINLLFLKPCNCAHQTSTTFA